MFFIFFFFFRELNVGGSTSDANMTVGASYRPQALHSIKLMDNRILDTTSASALISNFHLTGLDQMKPQPSWFSYNEYLRYKKDNSIIILSIIMIIIISLISIISNISHISINIIIIIMFIIIIIIIK